MHVQDLLGETEALGHQGVGREGGGHEGAAGVDGDGGEVWEGAGGGLDVIGGVACVLVVGKGHAGHADDGVALREGAGELELALGEGGDAPGGGGAAGLLLVPGDREVHGLGLVVGDAALGQRRGGGQGAGGLVGLAGAAALAGEGGAESLLAQKLGLDGGEGVVGGEVEVGGEGSGPSRTILQPLGFGREGAFEFNS